MSQRQNEIQPIELSPAPPLPPNTIIVKPDVLDAQKLAELKGQGINVTYIDLDIFDLQETKALEARRQAHEQRLAEIRLHAELEDGRDAARHSRYMQFFRFTGEFFLKCMVFAGGFYLTVHGDQQSGNVLMGAVASTFAKSFIERVWNKKF